MTMFYESGAIEITWNGVDLAKGLAEDSFLTIEPLADRVTATFSADGPMAISKSANKGATISLTLQQTSETNKDIAKIAAIQDVIGAAIPVSPFTVIDPTGDSAHFVALNAILSTTSSQEFGNAVGEKSWTWICESYLQAEDPATITSALASYVK